MATLEQVIDSNSASSVELIPSLIEQLGKAFHELEADKDASEDEFQWAEIQEYFHHLHSMLKNKLEELLVKEKEFAERESEMGRILAEKEVAVAAKEQESLDRIQKLKDAAVAAILEARAHHMPQPLEPSSAGHDILNKVSSSLDDENALTDAQEGKIPENTGVSSEGAIVEVNPRPEMMRFCEQVDAKGLLNFITENQKILPAISKELPVVLGSTGEPARLVLDSLEGFFPSTKPIQQGDNVDSIQQGDTGDASQQGDNGDAAQERGNGEHALLGLRQSCITLMEAFAAFLAKAEPDADTLLSPETKQQAKAIADEWKPKLAGEGSDSPNGSSLEAEAFLRLLAAFRIFPEFNEEELCELVLSVAHQRQAPELCRSLGLTHDKVQGIIDRLINCGKQIEAVHFIHSFGLSEKFPPVPLLKTYLKDLRRNSQGTGGSSGASAAPQMDVNAIELAALRAVIGCITEYKLEASYPLDPLQRRVLQLENVKGDKKRSAETGNKYHQKKQRVNGGFHGQRGRGVERHSSSFFDNRTAHSGMGQRFPHTRPSTFNYPVSGQPSYTRTNNQGSYYYPQTDRAAAPYNAGRPNYSNYTGSAMQQTHQPYM